MKFSIIIPIYNAEPYLCECIDSVLHQTYDDYELLLINDGSTDASYDICLNYELQNTKVKAYSKCNEGLSATRNFGLDRAKGDYILFLDSDDYIEKESLEIFSKKIQETGAEVIAAYAYHFENNRKKKSRSFLKIDDSILLNGIDFFRESLYQDNLRACAPFYVTNRKLIEKNHLRFKEGVYHEDELWTPIMLSYAKSVYDLKFYFYNYRISNEQSITRDPTKKQKRATDRMIISKELSIYFSKFKDKKYNCFFDNIAAQYMYAVYDGNLLDGGFKVDRKFPLKHAKSRKYIGKSLIFAFSPKIACLLRKYKG